jgi:hypothetical protein
MIARLTIHCDAAPFEAALASLAELAERSPELVRRFLDGLEDSTQLMRIESEGLTAAGAGECRTALHPSDLLVEFLAAARTGDLDGL